MKVTQVTTETQAEGMALWNDTSSIEADLQKAKDMAFEIVLILCRMIDAELHYATKKEQKTCYRIDRRTWLSQKRASDLLDSLQTLEQIHFQVLQAHAEKMEKREKAKDK